MNNDKSPNARNTGTSLRQLVEARCGELVPGAANALTAQVIADLGFEAIYVSGAAVSNAFLGMPDLGFVSLTELAQHVAAIRDAVNLPLIVDADTGFGNALNVRHVVHVLERAGANAIQLEDQVFPKRCGHFSGKKVISAAEMASKIRAAVDARHSQDLLVIARTDAGAVHGFQAGIERAAQFIEAGADVTFVEAPESVEELRRIPQLLSVPQVVNVVIGGRTPILDASELSAMGFGIILYANAALQGAILGMQNALRELKRCGRLDESAASVVSFAERQRLVNKQLWDEMDRRYSNAESESNG